MYFFSLLLFFFSDFSSFIAFTITKLEYYRRQAREASKKGAVHQTIKEIHWRKLSQNTPTIGLEKNRWKMEPLKIATIKLQEQNELI